MSYKIASKAKPKAFYATPSAQTRKLSRGKTFHYGKGLKLPAEPSKATLAGTKAKTIYGAHKPSGLKIHEAGYGVKYAEVAKEEEDHPLAEEEAELAERLVAEVADEGTDVKALCDTYQLKREELGRLTGFSLRALAEWASGNLPSQPAKRRLQEVRRLLDALAKIVKPESIPKWLHQPNPTFAPLTPLQVIELGEIDRLWAMVYDLGSGQPT